MATPYSKTVNQIKSQPVKIKGSWFLKHKVFVVISILIIAFIAWFNSDFWPWPSKDRIRERLDKVIDICTDNEDSSECKNIQKRYDITFRYCHSIADMNKAQTVYLNGKSYEMPSFSWYAVAWEGNSSEPPKNEIKLPNGTTMPGLNAYYGCQEHKK